MGKQGLTGAWMCFYVCVCVYVFWYIHKHTHACTHLRMHAHTHTHIFTQTHALTHARTHQRTHAHTHTLTHTDTLTLTHSHTHSEQHRQEGGEAGRPLTKQIFGCLTLHLFLRLSAAAYSSGYCPFLGSRLFGGRVQSVLGCGGVTSRTLAGLDASSQVGIWGAQRGGPVCR